MQVEGLLFDSDGVLVDSDASVTSAWTRWAARYDLDPTIVLPVVHSRRAEDTVAHFLPVEHCAAGLQLVNRLEIEDAEQVQALPGALELLTSLPVERWAIVTSALPDLALARLTSAQLPRPGVLITAADVALGKPAPDGYRSAAERLGIQAGRCVVFEDAPNGIAAARAAEVQAVVGVGERSVGTGADAIIDSLADARWEINTRRLHLA